MSVLRYFRFFLLLLTLSDINPAFSQTVQWSDTKNWKIYNVDGNNVFTLTPDSLQQYKSLSLNNDSIQNFLKAAAPIPAGNVPLWMGAYAISYIIQGDQTKIIIVSTYAGFFYDPLIKTYFQLPKDLRTNWLNYLAVYRGRL
jgi:hypothetical protein